MKIFITLKIASALFLMTNITIAEEKKTTSPPLEANQKEFQSEEHSKLQIASLASEIEHLETLIEYTVQINETRIKETRSDHRLASIVIALFTVILMALGYMNLRSLIKELISKRVEEKIEHKYNEEMTKIISNQIEKSQTAKAVQEALS